jgi:hypothetical protein
MEAFARSPQARGDDTRQQQDDDERIGEEGEELRQGHPAPARGRLVGSEYREPSPSLGASEALLG